MSWLDDLKVGDKVICGDKVERISRATKTQVCIARKNVAGQLFEVKFSRGSGWEVGASAWGGVYIRMHARAAEDELHLLKTLKNLNRLKHELRHRGPTLEQCGRIYCILSENDDG